MNKNKNELMEHFQAPREQPLTWALPLKKPKLPPVEVVEERRRRAEKQVSHAHPLSLSSIREKHGFR